MEPIILIGGGGHCISCIDVIKSSNSYYVAGIIDSQDKLGTFVSGVEVTGIDDDIPYLSKKYKNFLITIGQIKSPASRIKLYNIVKQSGGILPVIKSSRAYISSESRIEEGTIIMHNSMINAGACIGKCCIINTGSLIEHESEIGEFCHISTHSVINGQVKVGNKSFIGSNAVIANNVNLPDEIIVAAGASILRTPVSRGIYIGNPARKIR